MNVKLTAAVAILLSLSGSMPAHRLDEYLQATIIALEKDSVQGSMRLVPGVAVTPIVLASIDTNHDGFISGTEQHAYAWRVLRDLSLDLDGDRLNPLLILVAFPATQDMKEGLGEIHIEFRADLPPRGSHRKLIFQNHHQSSISVYLMNCLVPRDREIRIVSQNRNENQSLYELNYAQGGRSHISAVFSQRRIWEHLPPWHSTHR